MDSASDDAAEFCRVADLLISSPPSQQPLHLLTLKSLNRTILSNLNKKQDQLKSSAQSASAAHDDLQNLLYEKANLLSSIALAKTLRHPNLTNLAKSEKVTEADLIPDLAQHKDVSFYIPLPLHLHFTFTCCFSFF